MHGFAIEERSIANLLTRWLDRESELRFLVDDRFEMIWRSTAAAMWLGEPECVFKLSGELLVAKNGKLHARLTGLIDDCASPGTSTLSAGPEYSQQLLFCLTALGVFTGKNHYGLSVRRLDDPDAYHHVGLGKAFSLTPAEEGVVLQMTQGYTVENIARKSKTSRETVRTHMRRVYSKIGVSSREEMFSRLKPLLFARKF